MVVLIWVPLMVNERFTSLSFKLDHTFFFFKKMVFVVLYV